MGMGTDMVAMAIIVERHPMGIAMARAKDGSQSTRQTLDMARCRDLVGWLAHHTHSTMLVPVVPREMVARRGAMYTSYMQDLAANMPTLLGTDEMARARTLAKARAKARTEMQTMESLSLVLHGNLVLHRLHRDEDGLPGKQRERRADPSRSPARWMHLQAITLPDGICWRTDM